MRASTLGLGFFTVLLALITVGCGDKAPPALIYAGSGGGDEDSGADGAAALDGATPDGGTLPGDQCSDHLSGISCQVEEISADFDETYTTDLQGRFCARFVSGDVKCWGYLAADNTEAFGDNLPFLDLSAAATRLDAHDQTCILLAGNRVHCNNDAEVVSPTLPEVAFDAARPITKLAAGPWAGDTWLLFGDTDVTRWYRINLAQPSIQEQVTFPFTPVDIASDINASSMGVPRPISCALTSAGEVHCWGNNYFGSLGVGDTLPRDLQSTEAVALGAPATEIATANFRACAITDAGELKCWGARSVALGQGASEVIGEIGDEPGEIEALAPVPLGTGRTAVHVAMYGHMTCAILDNGALKCWGENVHGALGQGVSDQLLGDGQNELGDGMRAIDLGSGRTALQVVLGGYAACALLDDHSVKCWGTNSGLQLGIADENHRGDEPDEMGDALPRVDFGRDPRRRTGPIVSITSPMRATDPLIDPILTDADVTATCSVTPRDSAAAPVDTTSVVMRLHRGTEQGEVIDTATVIQVDATVFEGVFNAVNAAGSGVYWIECEASDTDDPANTSRRFSPILYDGGPDLAFISPSVDSQVVGQAAMLHLELVIAPYLLGAIDPGATVTAYEVTLSRVVIPLIAATTPGRYFADVDLLAGQFEPPPSGPILLSLEATNARGRTRRLDREVIVDGVGPVITVTGPQVEGTLVRGVQTIRLELADALAGPDMNSVIAYVANDATPVVFTFVTDHYEGVIDTLQYGMAATQLPIRIEASDRVGNVSDLPLTLRLDNFPPIVSLDPPMIREFKRGVGDDVVCSSPFDPVGSDSMNDQEVAPQGPEFRARIEDQNPLAGNGVVAPIADVDRDSVTVYMMNDLTRPILIDSDGDGVCDALNDELDALNANLLDDPTFVRRDLEAVAPAGRSDYPASAETDGLAPSWDSGMCAPGNDTVSPPRLCSVTSPLTRVIKAPIPGVIRPAIWGLASVDVNNCVGRAWDWVVQVPKGGPVCVVAQAQDMLGNVGVSVPLRVCLQRSSGTGNYDCNANLTWQGHNCLAGTYQGQTVSCTPPSDFSEGYVREDAP